MSLRVKYFPPAIDTDGKRLSYANIIWAERDRGDSYYSYSRFAMRAGKSPQDHPCSDSTQLDAFRARGYWASCFPEGDGITFQWWKNGQQDANKTDEQVMQDIRECFGWEVVNGRARR